MIYLASPYSHPNPAIRHGRYKVSCETTVDFIKRGIAIYSPIVHNHHLAQDFDLPRDFAFWEKMDLHILSACSSFAILTLPGWEDSQGVRSEVEQAKLWQMGVKQLTPSGPRWDYYRQLLEQKPLPPREELQDAET